MSANATVLTLRRSPAAAGAATGVPRAARNTGRFGFFDAAVLARLLPDWSFFAG
jgi:hypothetical protein